MKYRTNFPSFLSDCFMLQIGTITGANAQGWYAEKQLFQALKLVAAAQQGISVSSSMPLMDLDLALPVLVTNNNIQLGMCNNYFFIYWLGLA